MAKEVYSRMNDRMKTVYYYRRIEKINVEKVSKIINMSVGYVSETTKKADDLIENYLTEGDELSSPGEKAAVKYLLAHIIQSEKMNHEEETS